MELLIPTIPSKILLVFLIQVKVIIIYNILSKQKNRHHYWFSPLSQCFNSHFITNFYHFHLQNRYRLCSYLSSSFTVVLVFVLTIFFFHNWSACCYSCSSWSFCRMHSQHSNQCNIFFPSPPKDASYLLSLLLLFLFCDKDTEHMISLSKFLSILHRLVNYSHIPHNDNLVNDSGPIRFVSCSLEVW